MHSCSYDTASRRARKCLSLNMTSRSRQRVDADMINFRVRRLSHAQCTPPTPTRRNCRVESRRLLGFTWQFAGSRVRIMDEWWCKTAARLLHAQVGLSRSRRPGGPLGHAGAFPSASFSERYLNHDVRTFRRRRAFFFLSSKRISRRE